MSTYYKLWCIKNKNKNKLFIYKQPSHKNKCKIWTKCKKNVKMKIKTLWKLTKNIKDTFCKMIPLKMENIRQSNDF